MHFWGNAMQKTTIAPHRSVVVLLFDAFSNHCLANAIEPLRAANNLSGQNLYSWRYATIDGAQAVSSSGLPVAPEGALCDTPAADYLFVLPSYNHRSHANVGTSRALRSATQRFRTLVGLDMGAWLMAHAGLLDGYRATVHWDELTSFSETFADVAVAEDRFVIDRDRITCGGVTTTFELITEMIRRHHGPLLRMQVAALFMYGDRARLGDPALRRSGQQTVDACAALMQRNIEEPLSMPEIADRLGVAQKTLERLFSEHMDMSPARLYRHLRLRVARQLAEQTYLSITEIALRTGYKDASAMTRAFRSAFGVAPRDARNLTQNVPKVPDRH